MFDYFKFLSSEIFSIKKSQTSYCSRGKKMLTEKRYLPREWRKKLWEIERNIFNYFFFSGSKVSWTRNCRAVNTWWKVRKSLRSPTKKKTKCNFHPLCRSCWKQNLERMEVNLWLVPLGPRMSQRLAAWSQAKIRNRVEPWLRRLWRQWKAFELLMVNFFSLYKTSDNNTTTYFTYILTILYIHKV